MQPIVLQAVAPADPAVTSTTFQSGRRKTEESELLIIAGGDIPDRIADFRQ